jgi:hypothetical protein
MAAVVQPQSVEHLGAGRDLGRVGRFHPALHFYLAALGFGVVGTGLGAAMVTGSDGLRDAHVTVNLLGLVGLVIAGTLPFFIATQAA